MALNLASPGILIREVDLTIGRIDGTTGKVGGIVGSFEKGPVGEPTVITGENDLFDQFGQPYDTDKQYETWMVASSYLAYGGTLNVIRADDTNLKNAVAEADVSNVKIKSTEHYQELGYQENPLTTVTFAARNPGSWANDIRIAVIDGQADQKITVGSTTGISVGTGVTQTIPASTVISGVGGTTLLTGHFKGIVTGINTDTSVDVKVVGVVTAGGESAADYNSIYKFRASSSGEQINFSTGAGTTSASINRGVGDVSATTISAGVAITSFFVDKTGTLDQAGDAALLPTGTAIGIDTTGLVDSDFGATKFIGIGTEVISTAGASIGFGQITLSGAAARGVQGTSGTQHPDGTTIKFFTRNAGIATVASTITGSETSVGITTSANLSGKISAGGLLQFPSGELTSVTQFFDGTEAQTNATIAVDWFDQQTYEVTTASVGGEDTTVTAKWNAIADKPGTSDFAASRGGRFDEQEMLVQF